MTSQERIDAGIIDRADHLRDEAKDRALFGENMKLADYRDLIDSVCYWRVSFTSAATPEEREREAARLEKVVAELEAAHC
jgi:hypothetical protein